jgi:lambda family phage tail tape measure protein
MADLNYTVDVNTTPGVTSLKKLETQVNILNNGFIRFRNTLATLSFGAFASSALRYADAIQDISDTTGVATQTIIGFSNAVAQNGGNADQAQQSLLKFVQTIGDAVDGSNTAQKALADVGITLQDIQTLSEEDLLKRTVDGLGKMTNAAQRLAVQTALFGKNARGVNFPGVAGGMGTAVSDASKYSAAIKSAADAQQSLENNLRNLTTALLSVAKPLADIIKDVKISIGQFETLIKVVGVMGAVAAFGALGKGLYNLGKILNTFVFNSLRAVKDGMTVTVMASKTLGTTIKQITSAISQSGNAFAAMLAVLGLVGGALLKFGSLIFKFLAGPWGLLLTGIITFREELMDLIPGLRPVFDFIADGFDRVKKAMGFGKVEAPKLFEQADIRKIDNLTVGMDEASAKAKEFAERQAKLADEIRKTSSAYAVVNGEQLKNLQTETELIGKSEQEQEMTRAINDLYSRQVDALNQLLQKRAEYAKGTEEQKASLGVIDAEIQKVIQLTAVQRDALPKYISDLQSARLLEQDRVNNLDRITQALQRQQDQAGVTSSIYSNLQKQLGDIMFGKEQKGRSIFDQQKAEIERNIQLLEADMAGAITEAFSTEDGITNVQQYAIELKKVYDLTNQLRQAQLEQLDVSREWSTGWKDAFTQYMDNATNAAMRGKEAFAAFSNGINSAIDNFVNTGKFKFGDFARSIIQDLLKIELKAQATALFKGAAGGLGSLFSGLGTIFGFANGGNPPVNKPSIVGENGPELFVPKTQGTIIPNGGSTGTVNNYITNNNVSAVDGQSVARFFSENRRTLLGSMQMAQKELPYGNR